MTHIVFFDRREQVVWAAQSLPPSAGLLRVALTAEALQALEEYDLPHEPVYKYADTRQLSRVDEKFNVETYALAREIESFVAERCPSARFQGPGFLSGQSYHIQYAVSAIAKRALLMRDTIRACRADSAAVFDAAVDPWFAGDGYEQDPWMDVLAQLTKQYGVRLDRLRPTPITASQQQGRFSSSSADALQTFCVRAYRAIFRRAADLTMRQRLPLTRNGRLTGLRLLMVRTPAYDWGPVFEAIQAERGIECAVLDSAQLDGRWWTVHFSSCLQLGRSAPLDLDVESPKVDEVESKELTRLVAEWRRQRPAPPALDVLGMDVLPALETHLSAMTSLGPTLARHADRVAARVLEVVRPHAVCFPAMVSLADKRLAYQCRERDVPVLSYQHGFGYSVQIQAKDEGADATHADYFLTYGAGVQPRAGAAFPAQARYVPVGSARIERMIARRLPTPKLGRRCDVLWIADVSARNTVTTCQHEDTARYHLQKECLSLLSTASNVRVTYRPYSHSMAWDGTVAWLRSAGLRSVRVQASSRLEDLIVASDVVVIDSSSPTTWAEVIGLRKPLILYADPEQNPLVPSFQRDLERVCLWCRSKQALVVAVHRLAAEGSKFVAELQQIDSGEFIRNYVLHRDDGRCVQRVASFLNSVCRNRQSVDMWEAQCGQADQPSVDARQALTVD